MITRQDALDRAERWINADQVSGSRIEVGIHEFDLGYVVWGVDPVTDDPTLPPESVGGAHGVIDRETGELTLWPSIPVTAVADEYRRLRRAVADQDADRTLSEAPRPDSDTSSSA